MTNEPTPQDWLLNDFDEKYEIYLKGPKRTDAIDALESLTWETRYFLHDMQMMSALYGPDRHMLGYPSITDQEE